MPAPVGKIEQRVGENITRGIAWGARLAESPIATSSWVAVPSDLTLANAAVDNDTESTTVRVGGGAQGTVYQVTNTVTTVAGDTLKAYFEVMITG